MTLCLCSILPQIRRCLRVVVFVTLTMTGAPETCFQVTPCSECGNRVIKAVKLLGAGGCKSVRAIQTLQWCVCLHDTDPGAVCMARLRSSAYFFLFLHCEAAVES